MIKNRTDNYGRYKGGSHHSTSGSKPVSDDSLSDRRRTSAESHIKAYHDRNVPNHSSAKYKSFQDYRDKKGSNREVYRSPYIKPTKAQTHRTKFSWVKLQSLRGTRTKRYRCFEEQDIGFTDKRFLKQIVDVQADDDYATDDDIMQRSIAKVNDDLNKALDKQLKGYPILRKK
jgi:hypothetical protein